MRKLFLFLIPCLLIQSIAWAAPAQSLRQIIDEYQYSITVEWDQKDQAAFDAINSRFKEEVKALSLEGGLSVAEVREALQGRTDLDPMVLELLKGEDQQVVGEKLHDLIENRRETLYAQGSSWSPGAVVMVGLGILLVMEIIALTMRDSTCNNPGEPFPEDVRYECVWP